MSAITSSTYGLRALGLICINELILSSVVTLCALNQSVGWASAIGINRMNRRAVFIVSLFLRIFSLRGEAQVGQVSCRLYKVLLACFFRLLLTLWGRMV